MREPRVVFPPRFDPRTAPIHTVDEREIATSLEAAWARLVRAADWHRWYRNCRGLRFDPATPGPDLRLGTRFTWVTFGVRVHTTVEELVPNERLAWSGRAPAGVGYHGWVLERIGPQRVRVITEEVQRGPLPWLGRAILRPGLHRWHGRWIEGLAPSIDATSRGTARGAR